MDGGVHKMALPSLSRAWLCSATSSLNTLELCLLLLLFPLKES